MARTRTTLILVAAGVLSSGVALAQGASEAVAAATDRPDHEEEAPPPPTAPPAAPAPAPQPVPPPGAYPPPAPWGGYAWRAPAAPEAQRAAPVDSEPRAPLPPAGPPGWQAWIGARTLFIANRGFDPFSSDNVLPEVSLGASRRLLKWNRVSLAVGVMFDSGSTESTARGAAAALSTYRLLGGPELRWHLHPSFYVFGRPAAGVLRTSASLHDGTAGADLYSRAWLAAVDLDAGAAFAFWDLRGKSSELRFWAIADGGYAWAQTQPLALAPDDGAGAPQRTASLDLGDLGVRGPYFRIAVAATF